MTLSGRVKENTRRTPASDDSGVSYPPSLNKRYFFKLSSNLTGLVISVITQLIIPRGLGPKAYGDFNFLTNFFTQVINFLDMGTSTCYFTNVSRRPTDYGLVLFYSGFISIIFLLIICFVAVVHLSGLKDTIWPSQAMVYIYLAAGWGLLNWAVQIMSGMADAYGITVSAEKARMLQRVLGLAIILMLYFFHLLFLPQFFLYNYVILFFLIGALALIIGNHISLTRDKLVLSLKRIKEYGRTFFDYSHPIFIIALVVLVEGLFDRWLLQYYGGSIQQGFYSLSYQIGAVCFLFTGAMTPLLMREYSILHDTGNIGGMRCLFERYVPMLFTIAAFFSCFIMANAKNIVDIVGGQAFQGSILAVAIMALYPIHQTYGQLTSSLFYATGRTRLYRNIAVFFSLVSVPTTYFMLAPTDKFGLNAGATGLAAKMVLINIIAVNVQLYFNTRLLNLNYRSFFLHQLLCMSILIGLTYVVSSVVSHFICQPVARVLLSGVFYSAGVFGITCLKPEIFGFRKQDLLQAAKYVIDLLKELTRK